MIEFLRPVAGFITALVLVIAFLAVVVGIADGLTALIVWIAS
jgi:hypothetical protein